MRRDRFRQLVDEALLIIPTEFRDAMRNIAIVVEDAPTREQLVDVGIDPPDEVGMRHMNTQLNRDQVTRIGGVVAALMQG